MKRREFLETAVHTTLGATAFSLLGANGTIPSAPQAPIIPNEILAEATQNDNALPLINWEMPTSWPLSLDTIYGGATAFTQRVAALTQGRLNITARPAGEVLPPLEILNAVEAGTFPIGHTASYYYIGKSPVTAFGTTLPFGLTSRQQNAWWYEGGGQELMQQVYAEKFGVIQFPAGNTGAQMGGWFNKIINSPADLQALKMRIPGLGGQVMSKLGVDVQVLAGGEIIEALRSGAVDAAEWVGPYDDLKLGFQEVAQYYYYPGWWEPSAALELQINLGEWNNLPEIYREILKSAAYEANLALLSRYDALNFDALRTLVTETNMELRPFNDEVLHACEQAAFELYDEFSAADADFAAIFQEWLKFRDGIQAWHGLNETRYMNYMGGQG
ncbi:MAG: ABC transporter substrate-binding protein [Chloroflexi bacterium]|nr:ABC transporter substrate-binding protein [Chloroflexota bacterium]